MSWNGVGLALGPGKTMTMTVTGAASWCWPGPVSNTAWAMGWSGCLSDQGADGAFFALSTPVVPSVGLAMSLVPLAPVNGGPVTCRIVVTNSSGGTVTALTVTDTLPAQVTFGTEAHPAGFSFAPAGSLLVWSGSGLVLGPGRAYTMTVTGTVSSCYTGYVSNTAFAQAAAACGTSSGAVAAGFSLVAPVQVVSAQSSAPGRVSRGQFFSATLTVTNTGSSDITYLTPHLDLNAGSALVTYQSGPLPPGPVTLVPDAGITFTWTYLADTAGLVVITVTATGQACGVTPLLATAPTLSVTIEEVAALEAAAAITSATLCQGAAFEVTLTVTNTGGAAASGVVAAPWLVSGTGAAHVSSGPVPPMAATIPGGMSRTFTWIFTPDSVGVIGVSTTVTGADANTGSPLTTGVVVSPATGSTIQST